MIGNQRVKQRGEKADGGPYEKTPQGAYKIGDASRKKAHLEKSVKGKSHQHASGKPVADMINEPNQQGMHPGVVVAVGNKSQHLLKLVDTVRRHDSRILVEKIGEPAEHTQKESA